MKQSDTLSSTAINAMMFGTHFIMDLLAFMLVTFRASVVKLSLIARDKPNKHIFITNAEYGISSLLVVFMITDALAFGENIIRHLDDFGVPAEIASQYSDWIFIWQNYESIIGVLTGALFMLIWSMVVIPEARNEYLSVEAT
ncbi:hypothetical protein [Thalassomonas haliotis]|uniref:Uncharacterized protein n=1 Tax=Thalassomonas haliotis TaxID=485448 RepID=A0ABY7VCJ2_9GAMM|nr:hypothetical protein [Thalassomonas haliotis]WDE11006.1 hypothetical protein H3N35_22635 [Thalassomonas haliotis]